MDYNNFIDSVERCQGLVEGYPENPQALILFHKIISTKIKDIKVFNEILSKHLLVSPFFPKPVDLLKYLLKPLPKIEALKVLDENGYYHQRIRYLLDTKYTLVIPHKNDAIYLRRTDEMTADWISHIQFAVNRLSQDYKSLILREEEVFTKDVFEEVYNRTCSQTDELSFKITNLKLELSNKNDEFMDNKDHSKNDLIRNQISDIEKQLRKLEEFVV